MTHDTQASSTKDGDPADRLQFRLWLAACAILVLALLAIGLAWAVRHAVLNGPRLSDRQKQALIAVAEFPVLVGQVWKQEKPSSYPAPEGLTVRRQEVELSGWTRRFPAPTDTGFLLFSGVDAKSHRSIVKLIRIADGSEMARWAPNWTSLFRRISNKPFVQVGSPAMGHAIHPLLLDNGDIVFNTEHALVRMSPCDDQPVWLLDEQIHHSIELAGDNAIWVAGVASEGLADSPWLQARMRDDAMVRVSLADGRVLQRISVIKLLRDNGLGDLVLGFSGERLREDPIHLNQVTPAPTSSRHWQAGDLLISARNISTVLLYRPSTGKVLWHRTGPWLNQHAAMFVDEHRISVFDNHVVYPAPPASQAFLRPGDINRYFEFDFDTGELGQPFEASLAQAQPRTTSQGRARRLPDGGLFIEETDGGRLMRFMQDGLLWSLVNDLDDQRVGVLGWSRYLTADEARQPLQALSKLGCTRETRSQPDRMPG